MCIITGGTWALSRTYPWSVSKLLTIYCQISFYYSEVKVFGHSHVIDLTKLLVVRSEYSQPVNFGSHEMRVRIRTFISIPLLGL